MTTKNEYDIMIVGGGPAGISTWLHLHKYAPELAEKTVLIEKEKYPRDKLCGGALGGWTENSLKDLGIDLDIPYISINNFECRFKDNIYCLRQKKFFRIVRRIEFDHALIKQAIERGLFLRENESFLSISRIKNSLIVKTNLEEYRVKIIVGADGAFSLVQRAMKKPIKPRFAPAIEIFAPVNPQFDPEFGTNTAVIDFTPISEGLSGYVWHFPCFKDNQPYMNHGIVDFRINLKQKKSDLKKIFSRELKARNIHLKIKNWSGYPIPVYKETCSLSQPNMLLVGDAAGIDSAVGGGIHLALSYGELAAQTINNAFENNDFSLNNYKMQFQAHLVGKYIRKLNYLAKEMYENRMNPLEVSKIIFSKKSS